MKFRRIGIFTVVATSVSIALIGCAAETPKPPLASGDLVLQFSCAEIAGFIGNTTAESEGYYRASGFDTVLLQPTAAAADSTATALSRGQAQVGYLTSIEFLQAVSAGQPLVTIGVLPEAQASYCVASDGPADPDLVVSEAESSENANAEAEPVENNPDQLNLPQAGTKDNPWLIVTTWDQLQDHPDHLEAVLLADAAAWKSGLGKRELDPSGAEDSKASDTDVLSKYFKDAYLHDFSIAVVSDVAEAEGFSLPEEFLISYTPLDAMGEDLDSFIANLGIKPAK